MASLLGTHRYNPATDDLERTMPTTEAVGFVPPRLMNLMNAQMEAALVEAGFNPKAPGAGALVVFKTVRGMLTALGMLPDPVSPREVATSLAWQGQAAIARLGDLATHREIPSDGWVELARLPNLLRETAAQIDHLVSLYEEGK